MRLPPDGSPRVRLGRSAPGALSRRFQTAVGLPADGIAGPRTVHMTVTTLRQARPAV
ncbi:MULTISPECIES: peptidoglycan-binding domain-containing protein [Catenuloplanes]|uniref:Murein L,D-transpeptidase YcbB/YkuD n=1 Tax=Catenuloplanes niger TaxID=587534 RepID=A0AAE3ZKR9_9ACTN|nr:hypothetical protein [Catenuloplanes niger]MDR7320747.1 murein L,D-transpeptidase YcbB/YkuD [Catenuloplanes niger]